MRNSATLQLDYLSSAQIAAQAAPWWQNVLGVVGFERLPTMTRGDVPVAASMTPSLGDTGDMCEVWRVVNGSAAVGAALQQGVGAQGRVRYRACEEFVFGSITVDEAAALADATAATVDATRPSLSAAAALLQATTSAYEEIFELLRSTRHPHLIRIWNYVPEINGDADGDERYRHFNTARLAAFRKSGQATIGSVPAACALGSPAGSPISIYFLASRQPPMMIENPRQTSAYFYPPKFGIDRPIFSRASVLRDTSGTNLFISGTASIIGHETMHYGDVIAQTNETLANIEALLDEANRVVGAPRYALDGLKYKVYVRDPADLDAIKQVLATALQPGTSIVYLQADVCREELLVEIEATGESVREAAGAAQRQPPPRALNTAI